LGWSDVWRLKHVRVVRWFDGVVTSASHGRGVDPTDTAGLGSGMIRKLHIQNFKSIATLDLEPGRVNVLIGANGCGKSNFLEALAFAAADDANKLDVEFLTSRGVRVTAPEFMRSAFRVDANQEIVIDVVHDAGPIVPHRLVADQNAAYPKWRSTDPFRRSPLAEFLGLMAAADGDGEARRRFMRELISEVFPDPDVRAGMLDENETRFSSAAFSKLVLHLRQRESAGPLSSFLIYAPENTALRTFAPDGPILPLGIKGEGLFKLLRVLSQDPERWQELVTNLKLLDWFDDLQLAPEPAPFEQTLQIRDRFLAQELRHFDQRSANEGFLFLLFYFALVISPDTPAIFAVDNIDTSLNPKMATALVAHLARLARTYNKQIFLTTHSPAVLDGLNLHDDEQRLFVFHRNRRGETRSRRVSPPQPLAGETPTKLSDAFMRGLIGGLPQNFSI
jgi:predicted ATPase